MVFVIAQVEAEIHRQSPVDLPKLNDLLVPWPKGPAVHRLRDNSNVPMASAQPKWKEIPGFKKGFLVGG